MHVSPANQGLLPAFSGPGGAAYWRQCLRRLSRRRAELVARLVGSGLAAAWLQPLCCRLGRLVVWNSFGVVLCLRQIRLGASILNQLT